MATISDFIRKHPAYLKRRPFYIRFPNDSRVKLFGLDARGAVDFNIGVFYNRIPKAANSTIILNLSRLSFQSTIRPQDAKKMFLRPSRLSRAQLPDFDRLFKFTFVRNPYSRTLSAYLDKVMRIGKLDKVMAARGLDRRPTFLEFCRYLESGLYDNNHWAPQSALMLIPIGQLDFVGKVENFESDFRVVLDRIGASSKGYEYQQHEENRFSASQQIAAYYDAESFEIISRLFKRDFDTFGYAVM